VGCWLRWAWLVADAGITGQSLAPRRRAGGYGWGLAAAVLSQSGRDVQRDGQPVTDPVDRRRIMAEAVTTMFEKRLPVLRRLGALDG